MQLMYILQPTLNYRNAVIPEHWMTYERSILLHTPPDSMGLEHSAFKGVQHSHGNLHTKYNSIQKVCRCAGFWLRRVPLRESTRRVPGHILRRPRCDDLRVLPRPTLLLACDALAVKSAGDAASAELGRGPLITIILAGVASNT